LRSEEHIREALNWGVDRIVLGTRALQDPEWGEAMCRRFPLKVALGIDARDGRVAVHGWQETSGRTALDVARRVGEWPLSAIVYTDIGRDGMMQGPNVEATAEIARAVEVPVIASGGVTSLDDVAQLARRPISGCIIGRALYEGRIDLAAAIALARTEASHRPAPAPG
jgi:phosphoribosylformimino-5-aminoimidazole carboxamide ribotide isomerase